MYQLRIYTLRTAEALQDYATTHWPRHIPSLRAFGVTTHGNWTDHDADDEDGFDGAGGDADRQRRVSVRVDLEVGPPPGPDGEDGDLARTSSPRSAPGDRTRPLPYSCCDGRGPEQGVDRADAARPTGRRRASVGVLGASDPPHR
jgi:hypothetical protein